jgi:molecular chaperone DnaK
VTNPKNTVFSIKRFMGRRHNEVGSEEKIVPYEVVGGADELVKVKSGKDYTPPEISAMILQDLKKTAEDYLGEKVTARSSPCRPTSTTPSARPPRTPARSPGLKVERIINEPTAAASPTGWTRRRTRRSRCSTSAAARSTSPSSTSATNVFEVLAPTATPTSAATTTTRN